MIWCCFLIMYKFVCAEKVWVISGKHNLLSFVRQNECVRERMSCNK